MTIRTQMVHGKLRWRVTWRQEGKTMRRYFASEAEARAFAESMAHTKDESLKRLQMLAPLGRQILANVLERFDWDPLKLLGAVENYDRLLSTSKTWKEVMTEFVVERRASGVGSDYLRPVERVLWTFGTEAFISKLSDATSAKISEWSGVQDWNEATKRNYLKMLYTLFSFAQKKGYCVINPVADLLRQEPPKAHGWVYIVGSDGKYKIGMTTLPDLKNRAKYYVTATAKALELVAAIKTSFPRTVERELHKIFKEKGQHIRNEWFALTPGDFDLLKAKFGENYTSKSGESL